MRINIHTEVACKDNNLKFFVNNFFFSILNIHDNVQLCTVQRLIFIKTIWAKSDEWTGIHWNWITPTMAASAKSLLVRQRYHIWRQMARIVIPIATAKQQMEVSELSKKSFNFLTLQDIYNFFLILSEANKIFFHCEHFRPIVIQVLSDLLCFFLYTAYVWILQHALFTCEKSLSKHYFASSVVKYSAQT